MVVFDTFRQCLVCLITLTTISPTLKCFHKVHRLREQNQGLSSFLLCACQSYNSLLALQLLRILIHWKATFVEYTFFGGSIEVFRVHTAFVPVSSQTVLFILTMPFKMLTAIHELTVWTMFHILHHHACHNQLRIIQVLAELRHVTFASEDELLGRLTTCYTLEFWIVLDLANAFENLSAVCCSYTPAYLHDLFLSCWVSRWGRLLLKSWSGSLSFRSHWG